MSFSQRGNSSKREKRKPEIEFKKYINLTTPNLQMTSLPEQDIIVKKGSVRGWERFRSRFL
jgi:hypothetical protein